MIIVAQRTGQNPYQHQGREYTYCTVSDYKPGQEQWAQNCLWHVGGWINESVWVVPGTWGEAA